MKTVFMFSGQGSHYYHMGEQLLEADPTFRKHMHELDEMVRSEQGFSVLEEVYHASRKLVDPFLPLRVTHPAIFITGYALARTLEHYGMRPDYVLGCSLGEFAAATIAGIMDVSDALRLVTAQARMIEAYCTEGRMVAVLDDPAVYHRNTEIRYNSTLAALNGPAQFVISGERPALDTAKDFMKGREILHQELMVSYGFHSSAIDPAGGAYMAFLKTQRFRLPAIPFVSCVSGERLDTLPDRYLWDVVRQPTVYADAIGRLEDGPTGDDWMYIDLGPAGSLANLIRFNARDPSRSKGFQIMSPFRQEVKKLEEVKRFYKDNTKAPAISAPVISAPASKERLLAYVFPGQGSQKRGMGEGLFDAFPALTDRAADIVGYSIRELCLEDPQRRLNQTQYTQPALYVVNALSYLALQKETGLEPDYLAGHSLGEYNALVAAGGMDFETGLRLVQKRGALMAAMQDGGMAAVKGLDAEVIGDVIRRHGLEGVDMANYNTANQIVLSGPRATIAKAGPFFEAAGATLYFPLNVSGAFHSRYMQPARNEFADFLLQFTFSPLRIPVVSNVEACFYPDDGIGGLLTEQLVKPVRWLDSVCFLKGKGGVSFREVGPGDVLTKMIWSIEHQ